MRQTKDMSFAATLNLLRTRERNQPLTDQTKSMLSQCVREGPEDALHIYATNDEVNSFNLTMLKKRCVNLVEIGAKDFTKDSSTGKLNLRKKPISYKTE